MLPLRAKKGRTDKTRFTLGQVNPLLQVIGKGSFGKVFLARHKTEEKEYAIKVLVKAHIKKRNEIRHIMAERSVLVKNIKHPFLVGLHYSFQVGFYFRL